MTAEEVAGELGPLPGDLARAWLAHAKAIIAILRATDRDALPFALPDEVLDELEALLDEWAAAASGDTFWWRGSRSVDETVRLVRYWYNIDALPEHDRARLGITWSDASIRPFFDHVAERILAALAEHPDTASFGEALAELWTPLPPPPAPAP